jgi:hypothetical protein
MKGLIWCLIAIGTYIMLALFWTIGFADLHHYQNANCNWVLQCKGR